METILIVDDEKNYLRVLSAVLEEEGYEVLTALSGREALEIHETSDLDLTLTDMKMPGMDGIKLLEHIKAKAKRCLQLCSETFRQRTPHHLC
jgi:two-component system NtrC family response regulator